MLISPARPEEAALLTDIAFAAKRHWGYPESWIQRWTDDLTLSSTDIRQHVVACARRETGVCGFYSLKFSESGAELDDLWVLPSVMGQGIGQRLYVHAKTTARDRGASCMFWGSDPHAAGFYDRMGATCHGKQDATMDGTQRFLPQYHTMLA
jgi:GNAT superfamily N-acetyltransferase